MIPLINVSPQESRLPSFHSYFVWGDGEWCKTQEGQSLENANIRNANVELRH